MGCFDDDVRAAASIDNVVVLRYSAACHAFWAKSPQAPASGAGEISLEMQDRQPDGSWITVRTLYEQQLATDGPDWTNALGARNASFRFRGLYRTPSGSIYYTRWVTGGAQ